MTNAQICGCNTTPLLKEIFRLAGVDKTEKMLEN